MYFLFNSKPAYTNKREKLADNSATSKTIEVTRFNIRHKSSVAEGEKQMKRPANILPTFLLLNAVIERVKV